MAQSSQIIIHPVPLSDTDCTSARQLFGGGPLLTPPCLVDGQRQVTVISETSTNTAPPFPGGQSGVLVAGVYSVDFSGNLAVDGIPFTFDPNGPNGHYNYPANFIFPNLATVNVDANYTGELQYRYDPAFGQTAIDPSRIAEFHQISGLSATVNSIDVAVSDLELDDPTTGETFTIQLSTPDPTAIVDNSVNFVGKFAGTGSKITFGKIDGTATLITAPAGGPGSFVGTDSPILDSNGDVWGGYVSPFALDYGLTSTITTQLDENGLITPKVEVTDGVEMNGSRVTGLGGGVAATDAVNKGQLDAVGVTAGTALANAAAAQGTANTALANAAAAQGTANTALTTANQALARVDQVIAQNGNVVGNNNGGVSAQATGNGAMAGGSGTVADGAGAIAFGLDNKATGNGAVAIGDPNIATGNGAVAIGADNTATGDGAVALGNLSTAKGGTAIAIGDGASANGAGNIALGGGSSATGANSVALGAGSVASQANIVSVGAAGAERRVTNVAAGTAATDAVNKDQLDAEAAARQQFNLQMSQRQAVQEAATTSLTLGLANEMSARLAADNALSQRIDAVSTRIDQIESRMSVLDDRIASSTAVASALSGNAFLPDMKFNLTANVATYDGAHAGALQMGVLVSPNLALNAGVASGFNRRGKTAARAGMTIGF